MASTESAAETAIPVATQGCAWIEGQYVPMSEARVPILDVGFVWSDLTYDVVAVWDGRFFRLEDHLDRFEKACATIRLSWPMPRDEMRGILMEIVRRSGLRNAYVSMTVTRGVPAPGERDPRKFTPRFYAYAIPYIWIGRPDQRESGTDVIVARDVRRTPPGAINPTVKNYMWGDLIRGQFEAYDRGATLPLLTDGDGNITEGPGFNVFAIKDETLYTPARGVLLGITRQTAIDIANELGVPVVIDFLPTGTLYEADEIFITSTAGGIMPVVALDGEAVGQGTPGPLTSRIRETYWAWHSDPRFTTPVDYPS